MLRDVLAPWFGAGRWLVPVLLISFAVWIERRSASASRVPLRIALSLLALVGLLALVEIVFPTHGGRIGSIAGGGAASLLTGIGAFAAWVGILIAIGLILAESTVRRLFATLFAGAKVGAEVIGDGVEKLAAERERIMQEREAARAAEEARARDEAARQPVIAIAPPAITPEPPAAVETFAETEAVSVRAGSPARGSGVAPPTEAQRLGPGQDPMVQFRGGFPPRACLIPRQVRQPKRQHPPGKRRDHRAETARSRY